MVNASVPFAVLVSGRRKPTAQKRDACVVKDTVELFWFLSFFDLLFSFLWRDRRRAGLETLERGGEGCGGGGGAAL